jgi:hypothetical protein
VHTVVDGKPEENRPLGRWEDMRMDLREIEWEGVDWTHLARDTNQWWVLVYTVMYVQVS